MTSIGKYLNVELLDRGSKRKTDKWRVTSVRGDLLGEVHWFGRWRQYGFSPEISTTFNRGCLIDMAAFLDRVTKQWREGR